MEKRLALKGDDSFDAMNLKENLLRGIYEYGYKKPSMIQHKVIVPFSKGYDLVVQEMLGPGRTSTFCIGVLQRLNLHMHECQCIILAIGRQVTEIEEAMLKLGQYMGVKVAHLSFKKDGLSTDSSHVVVGYSEDVLYLVRRKMLCPEKIKMLVLDEANDWMNLDCRRCEVSEIVDYVRNKHKNRVQIGVFSETMPTLALSRIIEIMKKPMVIEAPRGHERSLHGIRKHMFLYLEEENSIAKKLKEIILKTHNAPIMVVFSNFADLKFLAEDLKGHGYKFSIVRDGMDQKERDGMKKDFLQSKLILTTRYSVYGIVEECRDEVRFIVHFNASIRAEDYIWKVGWFQSVHAAISFATSDDWFNLIWIQKEYNIRFERLQPSQNFAEIWRQKTVKVSTIEKEPIKHFILDCGDEEGKVETLLPNGPCSLYGKFDIARRSVIFVKHPHQIFWLAQQLKVDNKYKVLIPGERFIAHRILPTIFITADEKFDAVKVKVRLVVNFDVALVHESYDRRRRCCQRNGIFLLLATDADWCEVFDMQALHSVIFTDLPLDADDILKKMARTSISSSTSKGSRTRSQTRKRPRTRSETQRLLIN